MRLDEFQDQDTVGKIKVRDFLSALRDQHKLYQMGGAKRFYQIGNTGKMGVIFLLDHTTTGLGVAWSRGKKEIETVYIWKNLDPDQLADVAIDIPVGYAADEVVEKLQKFIKNPSTKLAEAEEPQEKPAVEGETAREPAAPPAAAAQPKPAASSPDDQKTPLTMVPAPKDISDDLVHRLIKKGEVVLMGRTATGEYFIIPNMQAKIKQLDAELDQHVAKESGGQTMEEQYEALEREVKKVAGNKARFTKAMVITGAPSAGKALALDTPLPSPDGWTTMGDVKTGDRLFDDEGKICRVLDVTPVQYDRHCFEVEFDDGTKVVADADHQWFTNTLSARVSERRAKKRTRLKASGFVPKRNGSDQSHKREYPSVKTTATISSTLRMGGKWNHHIINSKPVEHPEGELPIPPRILGMWLGDGTACGPTMTVGKQDIHEVVDIVSSYTECSYRETKKGLFILRFEPQSCGGVGHTNKFKDKLASLDLLKNKHIPDCYFVSSVEQRLELLRGIMDTDGSVRVNGKCELTLSHERLARDTARLMRSLGIKVRVSSSKSFLNGKRKQDRFRMHFTTNLPVFGLARKLERLAKGKNKSGGYRTIVACRPVESVPVKCILVDSPNHLFLCSESYIPTHNTFRVMKVVHELGLREGRDYVSKTGSITDTAFYRLLIEQLTGLIILDDCDSLWDSKDGANYLKGALNTDPVRSISKDTGRITNTGAMEADERKRWLEAASRILRNKPLAGDIQLVNPKLAGSKDHSPEAYAQQLAATQTHIMTFPPNRIDYRGRIIFISNMEREQFNSAVLSRVIHVDLNFSDEEMLDFIEMIGNKLERQDAQDGIQSLSDEEISEVFRFVRWKLATSGFSLPVNFRFIQKCFDYRRSESDTWKEAISKL